MKCANCLGEGWTPCPECTGEDVCETCTGNGWVDDPSDGGTKTCPECLGEPCPQCEGTMEIDCNACDSTGTQGSSDE